MVDVVIEADYLIDLGVEVPEPRLIYGRKKSPAIKQRQKTVDNLSKDISNTPGLPDDVYEVMDTYTINHEDTSNFSGVWEGDESYIGIGNGQPGGKLNWSADGTVNGEEIVDSMFHEIQHGRDPASAQVDHRTPEEKREFQDEVDRMKDTFYDRWGDKWR